MEASKCVDFLLNNEAKTSEKADYVFKYLDYQASILSSRIGLSKRKSRASAIRMLFDTLPESQKRMLLDIFDEIKTFTSHKRKAQAKETAKNLKGLKEGDSIVINNGYDEDVVIFLELKRTRFLCKYSDGRKFSVPVGLFIKKNENPSYSEV
jgi:hypothetical protein